MPNYALIVVGAGTSALNYLYALLKTDGPKSYSIAEAEKAFGKGKVPASVMKKLSGDFPESILVIGESDLWEKAGTFNPGYKVGQTSDHVRTPDSTRPVGTNSNFRPVSEYVSEMRGLRTAVEEGVRKIGSSISFLRDQVTKVSEGGDGYFVKALSRPIAYTCAKVIVASGAGPTSLPTPLKLENIKNKELLKNRRDYEEFIGGTEYLYSHAPKSKQVLVYGGAPTSAWVVARARQHNCRILWAARSGWDGANPAGRNKEVIEWAAKNKVMVKADITSVEIISPAIIGDPRILARLSDNKTYPLHQIIYATGADPLGKGGPGQILESNLRDKLTPRFDPNYRFSPTDEVPVAWATDNETCWVVGAPVFRALGTLGETGAEALKLFQGKYRKISAIMGEAGTPEEGVAVVTASIKSTTGYTQTGGNFNWNTADLLELRAFLTRAYGNAFTDNERNELAQKIVAARSQKGAYPVQFPREAFVKIIQDYGTLKRLTLPDPFSPDIKNFSGQYEWLAGS
jgi:Pyridine nucleotide-disulphide oxidoreductase